MKYSCLVGVLMYVIFAFMFIQDQIVYVYLCIIRGYDYEVPTESHP
jgi:hypothetical protein